MIEFDRVTVTYPEAEAPTIRDVSLVTYVKSVQVSGDTFTVETVMDEGTDVIEGQLPAVMTVVKEASSPRFASLSGWMEAKKTAIPRWGAKDGNKPNRWMRSAIRTRWPCRPNSRQTRARQTTESANG